MVAIPGLCLNTKTSNYDLSSLAWVGIVYSMVYSILLALSDTYAVTKLKPSFVAMWVVLEPAFTATISAIFVHENMSTIEILGSILTCCGLAVVLSSYQSGSKKEEIGGPTEASSAAGKAISDKSPLLA